MYLLERQTPISARPAGFVALVPGVAGFVPSSRLHVDLTGNALSAQVIPLGPRQQWKSSASSGRGARLASFPEPDFWLAGSEYGLALPHEPPTKSVSAGRTGVNTRHATDPGHGQRGEQRTTETPSLDQPCHPGCDTER
jgi:hypothetical protein